VTTAFAISIFYPVILGLYGFAEGSTALLWSTVISVVTLLGCVPCMHWVEKYGRRPVLIWNFAGVAASLALLGFFPAMAVVPALLLFTVNAMTHGGGNILQWIYPTELFPTDIRASAVGVASAVSRVGAAGGTYLLPLGLEKFGLGPTMVIGAAVASVGLLVAVLWAPETRGRALHEVAGSTASPARVGSFHGDVTKVG